MEITSFDAENLLGTALAVLAVEAQMRHGNGIDELFVFTLCAKIATVGLYWRYISNKLCCGLRLLSSSRMQTSCSAMD